MTTLDAFLYGMPIILVVGGAVTLWFAKRAAADIRSHNAPKSATVDEGGGKPMLGAAKSKVEVAV